MYQKNHLKRNKILISQAIDLFGNRYEITDEGSEGMSDYIVIDFDNGQSAIIWHFTSFVADSREVKRLLQEEVN
jgi:hypothetical protein